MKKISVTIRHNIRVYSHSSVVVFDDTTTRFALPFLCALNDYSLSTIASDNNKRTFIIIN